MQTEQRMGKALIEATRAFTCECKLTSWWHVLSTLALFIGCTVLLVRPLYIPLRLGLAALDALAIMRMFMLYHDHLHGSLLRDSVMARAIFWPFGLLIMAPPKMWRETHNYHHAHTAKLVGSHIGSYPVMTTHWWASATPGERGKYRFVRHPATIFFGYYTAFMLEMCALSFLRNPRKRWDSLLALLLNWTLSGLVIGFFGFATFFYAYFLPHFIACATGAYLFYAQHNFPEVVIQRRDQWEYDRAALHSSSFMEFGPLLVWFSANIGYHHVHHLNPSIPFYRLPEAMEAIPELQTPGKTALSPRSIAECFKLNLWDPEQGRMVAYPSRCELTPVRADAGAS
jgi:acyl-lipid omega-6 desaturase (Delta-12 desaturase)